MLTNQFPAKPVSIVLRLDAVAASADVGAVANPPGAHREPHAELLLAILLPHVHLVELS